MPTSLKFNLLVCGDIYSSQSGYSAWRFCQAAIAQGHTIAQVFFYQAGATQASANVTLLADEFNPVARWTELADQHRVRLVVCVSAAERRGVLGEAQCDYHQAGVANLAPGFDVEGLGALHAAMLENDRTITFK